MMNILAISGSASLHSSNAAFLHALASILTKRFKIEVYQGLRDLPLFRPEDLEGALPEKVVALKSKINQSDAVVICTPEYTHNIPAVLKNGLEWITASGELERKRVIALTFTPHEPRGKWAMESLLNSLQTMNAIILVQMPLYRNEVMIKGQEILLSDDYIYMLEEAFSLLEK
jgi:chromate reductase, NAD(P)H dehydrogenase (quinone)